MSKVHYGYVVERYMDEKMIEESRSEYIEIKSKLTPEKWEETIKHLPMIEKFINGEVKPHWFGIKGFADYLRAKTHAMQQEDTVGVKHRVVKASFPTENTWLGYKIIPWK